MSRAVLIAVLGFAAALAALGLTMSLDSGPEAEAERAPLPPVASEPARPLAVVPAFDVVRVGERGDVVVAGRAAAKAEVVLWDESREVGRVIADERGEWVLVPTEPLAVGQHALSLGGHAADGTVLRSVETVYLVVPDHAGQGATAVAARPGAARLMLGGVAGGSALTLDVASRDGAALLLAGRAPMGMHVRVFLDSQPLGTVRADDGGNWSLPVTQAASLGRVRVEGLDEHGRVQARAEAPLVSPGNPSAPQGDGRWLVVRRDGDDSYTVVYGAARP